MIMQLGRTIETPGRARADRGPVAGLADARLSSQPAVVRLARDAAGCQQSSRTAGHALCCAACSCRGSRTEPMKRNRASLDFRNERPGR